MMNIDVKEFGDVRVLSVKGNMMGGPSTTAVHEKVKELASSGHKKIVIDLSGVKWMNNIGLGTMMGCLTTLNHANGDLKLAGVTEKVKSLFFITKLDTLFEVHLTSEEAVESFKETEEEKL